MKSPRAVPLFIVLLSILAVGCASGRENPALPTDDFADFHNIGQSNASVQSNRLLWGLWEITISADRQTVEIITARSEQMHLNVVRLIEVSPCVTCLKIDNIKVVEPNVLEADLTLIHPYPGLLQYTGFDVRGVFISQANYTFPTSGRKIAWGTDVPMVLNSDGYTALFNPTEFPETKPGFPALRYIPGKYATGGDLTATLDPYLAFRRDAPRCMFEAGGSETRTVRLYAPTGPIHFGYAVDACWQSVEDVVDPLTDFPPDANCLEAYRISVAIPYDFNSSWMSQNPVSVEVFDHQGLDTISAVTVEAPDLFAGEVALAYSVQTGEDSWLFSGMIPNEKDALQGSYHALVRVTDANKDQNLGAIDAWGVTSARVKEGWARTWGGNSHDQGYGVAVDGSGNIYVTGYFSETVDFDPGSGVDNHTSNGGSDIFLSKFDSSGIFLWTETWGGMAGDYAADVAADGLGNVYVTGTFGKTVDFDPGSGVDNHTSNGVDDAFLSSFHSSGDFVWARTWGGDLSCSGQDVVVDDAGSAYVIGDFDMTADFDPGSGVDSHSSNGSTDTFLSKFDALGNFIWAETWGGSDNDVASAVAINNLGDISITGPFCCSTVDFDPGSGVDNHTPIGGFDAFLSKFDSSGCFLWARTWGGDFSESGAGVAADNSGNVYVTGRFTETADFDPGIGVDNHTSNGDHDIFLSKFDSSGNYLWAKTWGGSGEDTGYRIAMDESGSVYVAGIFADTVDFDPGSGGDYHTSNGLQDVFLSKFDSSDNFLWAKTWGGSDTDIGSSIATDGSGNAYVTGRFAGIADLDPGEGADNHTSNGAYDAFLSKFPPDGNW